MEDDPNPSGINNYYSQGIIHEQPEVDHYNERTQVVNRLKDLTKNGAEFIYFADYQDMGLVGLAMFGDRNGVVVECGKHCPVTESQVDERGCDHMLRQISGEDKRYRKHYAPHRRLQIDYSALEQMHPDEVLNSLA